MGWNKRLTQDEVIGRFVEKHNDRYDYSKVVFKDTKSKVIIICKLHGEFTQEVGSHARGAGCPKCAGVTLSDNNRISIVRPDLLKYLRNKEDGDNYAVGSNKRIQLKCPECDKDKKKLLSPNSLTRGFSCDYCSDGISIPEKWTSNLLLELGIDFEPQKILDKSNRKMYDFYFEVNGTPYIIECHGGFHYNETKRANLEKTIVNDLYKFESALLYGIELENYIVVDCRYSKFEWLKENFIKELSNCFDLSNINWIKIWENCQSSLMVRVCEAWNNKNEYETSNHMAEKFKLSRPTITSYLSRGDDIGICKYNKNEEKKKAHSKLANNRKESAQIVHQYTIDGLFIKTWGSMQEASLSLGIEPWRIWNCAKGNIKMAGEFRWCYEIEDFLPPIIYDKGNKTVYQYSKDGDFIKEWNSFTEAEKGSGAKNISRVANGKVKSGLCNGYRWSYVKLHDIEEVEETPVV